MNAAIRCTCDNVIVYNSLRTTTVKCPKCQRKWSQQPSMYSDDGIEAVKLPYLMDGITGYPPEATAEIIGSRLKEAYLQSQNICGTFPGLGEPKAMPKSLTLFWPEGLRPTTIDL